MGNNDVWDLYAVGAGSTPESIGAPGINNNATIKIHGYGSSNGLWQPVEFFADTIPNDLSLINPVNVIR